MVAVTYKSKSIRKKEHVSVFLLKDSYGGKKTRSVNCYSQLQAVTSFLLSVARANRLGLCEEAELCGWDLFWGAGLCQRYPIPRKPPANCQAFRLTHECSIPAAKFKITRNSFAA